MVRSSHSALRWSQAGRQPVFASSTCRVSICMRCHLMRVAKPHLQERVTVSGNTDNVGASAYNLTQSRERAQSIAGTQNLHGARAERLTVAGYGEESPRASKETEAGRA